ncbi:MAG: hypothetical protein KDB36_07420, partial [Acidimicrobiales bacterium]|nr:hypothetical protein [Acidimicrobiales bacterium]
LLVGDTQPVLDGSLWARNRGHRTGTLPTIDWADHAAVCAAVRSLVLGDLLWGVHDVASDGLGLALAELAVRSGIGVQVARVPDAATLFSESPSRAVLCVDPERLTTVEQTLEAAGVSATRIGVASGDRISVKGLVDVALADATAAYRDRLPEAVGAGTTQG